MGVGGVRVTKIFSKNLNIRFSQILLGCPFDGKTHVTQNHFQLEGELKNFLIFGICFLEGGR